MALSCQTREKALVRISRSRLKSPLCAISRGQHTSQQNHGTSSGYDIEQISRDIGKSRYRETS